MKLLVRPENGWVHVLRDNDFERTIFFIRPGVSLVFVCQVSDEEKLITIPISYKGKNKGLTVDGVELTEDTEISIKKDAFVETFAFLTETEIENYGSYAKPFTRKGDIL